MPCYNQGRFMQEALDSLYAQTLKPEIIIVDDGSIDNSKEIIEQNRAKIDKIITLEKNRGIPNAINEGIKISKGEYITNLSQDDRFEPTYLEKAVNKLEQNPKAGVCACDLMTFGSNEMLLKPSCVWTMEALRFNTVVWGTSVVRKDVYDKLGGWDDRAQHYSDWEMWCRICQAGWGLEYIPEPLYFFRQHETQVSNGVREDLRDYIRNKYAN